MNKKNYFSLFVILAVAVFAPFAAQARDLTYDMPVINPNCYDEYHESAEPYGIKANPSDNNDFHTFYCVANYGESDWSNVVGIARGITREQAMAIALAHPEIHSFFYTKGARMVLCAAGGSCKDYRIFYHGDTVFFSSKPWWAPAPKLADGYTKRSAVK